MTLQLDRVVMAPGCVMTGRLVGVMACRPLMRLFDRNQRGVAGRGPSNPGKHNAQHQNREKPFHTLSPTNFS